MNALHHRIAIAKAHGDDVIPITFAELAEVIDAATIIERKRCADKCISVYAFHAAELIREDGYAR